MDKILTIDFDDSPDCPTDWAGSWTLHSFLDKHRLHKNVWDFVGRYDRGTGEVTPANIGLRRKLQVGLAFWLEYYEHGEGHFSIRGTGMRCPWDTTTLAGILLWEHPPKEMGDAKTYAHRAHIAKRFLEIYNAWANGYVYCVAVQAADHEEGEFEGGSCCGFYNKEEILDFIKSEELLKPGDRVKVEGKAKDGFDACDLPEGVELVEEFEDEEVGA